jgi:hypothetical protein
MIDLRRKYSIAEVAVLVLAASAVIFMISKVYNSAIHPTDRKLVLSCLSDPNVEQNLVGNPTWKKIRDVEGSEEVTITSTRKANQTGQVIFYLFDGRKEVCIIPN